MLKAYADVQVTHAAVGGRRSDRDVGLVRARQREQPARAGRHLLPRSRHAATGYAVVNLGATLPASTRWLQLFAQINNLFDTRYYTAAQLGPLASPATGTFIARPFPAVNGEFPVRQTTFFAPGAPVRAWGGLRFTF